MCAQTLRSYFESDYQQHRALGALDDLFVPEELDLYNASQRAFDPTSNAAEAIRHFEKIYDELAHNRPPSYWNVFRPFPLEACWRTQEIFDTIKREFPEFSWRGSINLLNFQEKVTLARLESRLAKMQGIKPTKGYPHMPVSKFLHFYNPGLFPIYDTKVIWNEVLTRFKVPDFRDFCSEAVPSISYVRAITDEVVTWLIHYMRWASYLLRAAHANFMPVFVDWLQKQPGARSYLRGEFDPATLYARAFEYTAVGAARAS